MVDNYNSRPREMINDVLQNLQEKKNMLSKDLVETILERTICLMVLFADSVYVHYLVDACIPFSVDNWEKITSSIPSIKNDEVIKGTFEKSPATTSNVNKRLSRMIEIIGE